MSSGKHYGPRPGHECGKNIPAYPQRLSCFCQQQSGVFARSTGNIQDLTARLQVPFDILHGQGDLKNILIQPPVLFRNMLFVILPDLILFLIFHSNANYQRFNSRLLFMKHHQKLFISDTPFFFAYKYKILYIF